MNKKIKGQSLLEVLIALAIAVIVVLALVRAVTVAIRNASFARSQASATKYAQEGMEWLRAERDKKWSDFSDRAGATYCLNELSWPAAGPCFSSSFITGTSFQREAVLTDLGGDKIEAKVEVSWQDAQGTHQSQLFSYFTKWQKYGSGI